MGVILPSLLPSHPHPATPSVTSTPSFNFSLLCYPPPRTALRAPFSHVSYYSTLFPNPRSDKAYHRSSFPSRLPPSVALLSFWSRQLSGEPSHFGFFLFSILLHLAGVILLAARLLSPLQFHRHSSVAPRCAPYRRRDAKILRPHTLLPHHPPHFLRVLLTSLCHSSRHSFLSAPVAPACLPH